MDKATKAAKANPDLPRRFIKGALLATKQMKSGLAKPYQAPKNRKIITL